MRTVRLESFCGLLQRLFFQENGSKRKSADVSAIPRATGPRKDMEASAMPVAPLVLTNLRWRK